MALMGGEGMDAKTVGTDGDGNSAAAQRAPAKEEGPAGRGLPGVFGVRTDQKSMSPPWLWPAPAGCSSFCSATSASVVSSRAAMEAAFCSVERVTLAGSMTPALNMSVNSPVAAL